MQSLGGAHSGRASSPTARPDGGATERSRPVVPNGRALVGGLLVTLSAVGLFGAHQAATARVVPSYVVASRDVLPGSVIVPGDVELVPIELPRAQRARAFDDADVVVGALAVAPITAGDVVQASALAAGAALPGRAEVSLPVDPSRALGGRLDAGEWVDVVATFGTGEGATVQTVARGAVVVLAEGGGAGIGSADSLMVILAVAPGEAEELTRASVAGELSLVRRGDTGDTGES